MKMYSKIIFFVATFCVVNSSAILNNKDDNSVASSLTDFEIAENEDWNVKSKCHVQSCRNLCARYGLFGLCIQGRCVCRSHVRAQDDVSAAVPAQTNYIMESKEDWNVKSKCHVQSCRNLCARYGLFGLCIQGRCVCRSHVRAQENVPLEDLDAATNYQELKN
ncbi:uncharacterized protein LOC142974300 [Anticarsia gemmatalis]|uniref:uncharacterized protein LOC142974300 n=1 Tax=Anticarsia gemmatalis TaxID=129554 RepID=UPI003F776FA2